MNFIDMPSFEPIKSYKPFTHVRYTDYWTHLQLFYSNSTSGGQNGKRIPRA